MGHGKGCQVAKAGQVKRGTSWRAHPVPYGDVSYPWTVPPMACAFCSTKDAKPYRILRCDSGQTLVLHNDCGEAAASRLNPLPLGAIA